MAETEYRNSDSDSDSDSRSRHEINFEDEPWMYAYLQSRASNRYMPFLALIRPRVDISDPSEIPPIDREHESSHKRVHRPADYPLVSPLYDRIEAAMGGRRAFNDLGDLAFTLNSSYFDRTGLLTNPRDILNLRQVSRELYTSVVMSDFNTLEFKFTKLDSYIYFLLRFGLSSATEIWHSKLWQNVRKWAESDPVAQRYIQMGTPYVLHQVRHLSLLLSNDEVDSFWHGDKTQKELFDINPCLFTGLDTLTLSYAMMYLLRHAGMWINDRAPWCSVHTLKINGLSRYKPWNALYKVIANQQCILTISERRTRFTDVEWIQALFAGSENEMKVCGQYNERMGSICGEGWCTSDDMVLLIEFQVIANKPKFDRDCLCSARSLFMSRVQFSLSGYDEDDVPPPYLTSDIQSLLTIPDYVFPNLKKVEFFECGAADIFLAGCIVNYSDVEFVVNNQRVDLNNIQTQQDILLRVRRMYMDYVAYTSFKYDYETRTRYVVPAVESYPLLMEEPDLLIHFASDDDDGNGDGDV